MSYLVLFSTKVKMIIDGTFLTLNLFKSNAFPLMGFYTGSEIYKWTLRVASEKLSLFLWSPTTHSGLFALVQ